MSLLAILLVLAAALLHATWNLYAKRVGGGAAFVWLFQALGSLIFAPLAAVVVIARRPTIGKAELGFMLGSAVLHIAYFLLLQRGYQTGDLSLVYPLARGTGPLLATVAAIVLLDERPTPLALAGAVIVVVAAFALAGGPRRSVGGTGTAVAYGLLTGLVIAAYTLWDKYAVGVLLVSPLLYEWGFSLLEVLLLAPAAYRQRATVRHHWHNHRREALVIGALSPLAYILVLTALAFTPVSYVAPAREISILAGVVLGARLLAEGNVARRLVAASAMVVGVMALAFG